MVKVLTPFDVAQSSNSSHQRLSRSHEILCFGFGFDDNIVVHVSSLSVVYVFCMFT